MPASRETLFFPSRPLQRLEEEPSLILDVDEATGAPRLTTCDLFGSESRNGLLCGNNPVNWSDPLGTAPYGYGSESPDYSAMSPSQQLFFSGAANFAIGTFTGIGVAIAGPESGGTSIVVFGHQAVFSITAGISQMVASVAGTPQQQQGANAYPTNISTAISQVSPAIVGTLAQFAEAAYSIYSPFNEIRNAGMSLGPVLDIGLSLYDTSHLFPGKQSSTSNEIPFSGIHVTLRGGGFGSNEGGSGGSFNSPGVFSPNGNSFTNANGDSAFGGSVFYSGPIIGYGPSNDSSGAPTKPQPPPKKLK